MVFSNINYCMVRSDVPVVSAREKWPSIRKHQTLFFTKKKENIKFFKRIKYGSSLLRTTPWGLGAKNPSG